MSVNEKAVGVASTRGQLALDTAPDPVYWFDKDGNVVYANRAARSWSGITETGPASLTIFRLDKHLSRAGWAITYARILAGDLCRLETRFRHKDKTLHPVIVSFSIADDTPEPPVCAYVRDLQDELQPDSMAATVKAAIDNAAVDEIFISDMDGNILYANDSACRALGYTRAELVSMSVLDLNPALTRRMFKKNNKRARREGIQILHGYHRRKDGTLFPVEISHRIENIEGRELSCSIVRDISERKKGEKELELLRYALEKAADAVYLTDAEGRIYYVNESARRMLGYSREELLSMNVFDIDASISTAPEMDDHRKLMQRKEGIFETTQIARDGTAVPVEITFSNAVFDDITYSFSFARDITERKEVERRNEELSFAVENAIESVFLNDEDGNIFYANKSACESLGYTYDELTSMNIGDIDEHFSPQVLKLLRENRLDELPPPPSEIQHRRKDGSTFPVEVTFNSRVIDGSHNYCSFVRDISDRRETEAENKTLRAAIDQALDAVYIFDRDGCIQYANESASRELGYTVEELQTMRIRDIDPTVYGSPEREIVRQQRWQEGMEGRQIIFETYHQRKDGSIFPVECSHSGITVGNTRELGISFARNITERKEELRRNNELRFAIENSIDAVFLVRNDGNIYYVNQSACEMLGYSYDELTSMTIFDIDPYISRETFNKQWLGNWRDTVTTFQATHRRRDGTEFPVEVSSRVTEYDGVEYACSFARDITDRKEAMRHMEEFRFAIDNANDPVYLYDRQGNIIYGNNMACSTLGYTKEEITGLKVWDLDPRVTPEIWERIYPRVEAGELKTFESINRKKDGTEYPVEVTATNVTYDDYQFGCSFNHDITERKKEERQLLFLQFAIESAGDSIFITRNDGTIVYANQSACQSLGYSEDELLQLRVPDINPAINELREDIEYWESEHNSVPHTVESIHKRKDGSTFPIEIQSRSINFDGDSFNCAVVRDITERKKAQAALQESEERFRAIADTSPVALLLSHAGNGSILYANRQAEILFGKTSEQMVDNTISDLFDAAEGKHEILEIMHSRKNVLGQDVMLKKGNGSELCLSLSTRSIQLHGEEVICSALLDITEAHKLAEQLSYQASYDVLTNLVNRREFQSHLQRVLVTARQAKTENALCFMDLDQFKIVNDTCGHIAGDELLRQLGQLLQHNIRKRDILARLGGDEFAILLENCNLQQAERVANAIRQAVQDFRFHWDEHTFNIGVSIGLVPIDWRSETVIDVLRRADTACYTAKDMGRNRIHVYHPDDEELAKRHGEMRWISRINEALEQNRLQLWAQRIMPLGAAVDSGEHIEVLLRMQDKDGNIIAPASFFPTAERYNIAPRIDRWVITTILNWYARNPDKLERLSLCSVNLSGQSLSNEELLDYIINYFETSGIQPQKFCFEVTETAAIANLAYATHFIKRLKEHGCHFALDDFGSGLSSFAYLKNLPVDFIKIDGQFVKDILDDPIDLAMVRSINEIGQIMGKVTVAEFVESNAVLEKLKEVGVNYAQGFAIAKPAPLITASAIRKIYH